MKGKGAQAVDGGVAAIARGRARAVASAVTAGRSAANDGEADCEGVRVHCAPVVTISDSRKGSGDGDGDGRRRAQDPAGAKRTQRIGGHEAGGEARGGGGGADHDVV